MGVAVSDMGVAVSFGWEVGPGLERVAVGGSGVGGAGVGVRVTTVKLGIPMTWLDFDCGLNKKVAVNPVIKINKMIRRDIINLINGGKGAELQGQRVTLPPQLTGKSL